jgi:pyruvate dehydrogenase E1 component beta subunit
MRWLAEQGNTVFLGQGLINSGRVYGTMNDVALDKCIEMPVAEDLITGIGIGMSFEGYKPILVFQRMDFMLIASDQIINHMCLIPKLSNNQYPCGVIIRAIIGQQGTKFDVGAQHRHDFRHVFEPYIEVVAVKEPNQVIYEYQRAYRKSKPIMIVEFNDLYERGEK